MGPRFAFGLWTIAIVLAVVGSFYYLYQEQLPVFWTPSSVKVEACPPTYVEGVAGCYVKMAQVSIGNISRDLTWWTRYLNLCVFGSIFFGVVSTVVISLQGEAKNDALKAIGVVSTVLATSLTTTMSTFHVHDSIDKLIEVRSKLGSLVNNLQHDLSREPSIEKKNEIIFVFVTSHQTLIDDAMKVKGSPGRLNSKQPQ